MAPAIAKRTGAPLVELDAYRISQAGTALPDQDFRAAIPAATSGEVWVVDGNDTVRDLVDARATRVVWLDLPRAGPSK